MGAIQQLLAAGIGAPAPATPFDTLVTAANPVMWFKMEEVAGTAAANSGSSSGTPATAGTLTGGASFATAGVAAASGMAGLKRGLDLNVASANDVRTGTLSGAPKNALGGAGSASSWTIVLYVTGGSATGYIASRTNDFAVIHNFVAGFVEFFASTGLTGSDPRPGSQMALSNVDSTTVHQVAYRYDNGQWAGILDGVEIFNVARSFGLGTGTSNFYMGSDSTTSRSNVKMYDVQNYDRAVSTADLAAMWAARNNP